MGVAQLVVTVAGQQQRGHPPQAAAKEAEQVDRGLVGPVDVLHHRHGEGRRRVDLGQEGREQPVPRGLTTAEPSEFPAGLRGDIEQGTQRPGGEQALAGAPQTASVRQPGLERLEERRLPDPGLPRHQDVPAVALPGFAGVLGQRLQKQCPFQQLHDAPEITARPR